MPTVELVANSYGDLAAFEVQGLPVGYTVADIITGEQWILSNSTATVDHVNVEAARGQPDRRWLRDQGGGGGGGFDAFDVRYVHPDGDNANDGTIGSPMKTLSYAYNSLSPGGILYMADATYWSDGTEGLGLALGDGMFIDGWSLPMPKALAPKPCTVKAWGPSNYSQFGTPFARLLAGDGDPSNYDRTTSPGIWLASTAVPIIFDQVGVIARQPCRIGWNYRRNADNSVGWGNITSASRNGTAGTSTFTVSYPTAWTLTAIGRTSNVVTARFVSPELPSLQPDTYVHIVSADPNFATGDYLITSSASLGGNTIQFTYAESGSNVTFAAPGASITAGGHMVAPGDMIEVLSSHASWKYTSYSVISITATTITVRDGWGGTVGATANIGQYVLQVRYAAATAYDRLIGCAMLVVGGNTAGGQANLGPAIDRGSTSSGGFSWVDGGHFRSCGFDAGGGVQGVKEPNILAGHFASGGAAGVVGFIQRDSILLQGNIRVQVSTTNRWLLNAEDMVQDSSFDVALRPIVEVFSPTGSAGSGAYIYLKNLHNADSPATDPTVDMGYCAPSKTVIIDCDLVIGVKDSRGNTHQYGTIIFNENDAWGNLEATYEAEGKLGWYGNDGRLAGKREDVQSQFGVVQGRAHANLLNVNLLDAFWDPGATTITGNRNTAELDGMNDAFRIAGGGVVQPDTAPSISAAALGDHLIFGAWMRAVNGNFRPSGALLTLRYLGGVGIENMFPPIAGSQWTWITTIREADANDVGLTNIELLINQANGYDIEIKFPHLLNLPVATYSKNAAYRILHTFRPFGGFAAGLAGTHTGVKLIGTAGLGSGLAYVEGVGAGQLTVVGSFTPKKYEPIYAANGTIKGWVEMINATVNP